MIRKTAALLELYQNQQQGGHTNDDIADEMRDAIEDEIAQEDNRYFRPGDPIGQQLSKPVGKMLKAKPSSRFDDAREGARGARG